MDYLIRVNEPGQVESAYDDGTVTIYTRAGSFTIDCATDEQALDLISNIALARCAKTISERGRMETELAPITACPTCGSTDPAVIAWSPAHDIDDPTWDCRDAFHRDPEEVDRLADVEHYARLERRERKEAARSWDDLSVPPIATQVRELA